jgi:hypothetical protein
MGTTTQKKKRQKALLNRSATSVETNASDVTFQISESPQPLLIRGPIAAIELVQHWMRQAHEQRPSSVSQMIPFSRELPMDEQRILVWDNSLKHSAYMLYDATRYTREWLEEQTYTHWTPDFEDPNP